MGPHLAVAEVGRHVGELPDLEEGPAAGGGDRGAGSGGIERGHAGAKRAIRAQQPYAWQRIFQVVCARPCVSSATRVRGIVLLLRPGSEQVGWSGSRLGERDGCEGQVHSPSSASVPGSSLRNLGSPFMRLVVEANRSWLETSAALPVSPSATSTASGRNADGVPVRRSSKQVCVLVSTPMRRGLRSMEGGVGGGPQWSWEVTGGMHGPRCCGYLSSLPSPSLPLRKLLAGGVVPSRAKRFVSANCGRLEVLSKLGRW